MNNFEKFMMITNAGIVSGVWITFIYIISQGQPMNISKKIYRMAVGWDTNHVDHDPLIPCGEAEMIAEEEAEEYIDKYIDSLEAFHQSTMSFLKSLDVYDNDDRLGKVKELQALLKHGEDIKEFVLDGNVHTVDQERRWRVHQGD